MTPQDRVKRAHIAIMQHKKFCAFAPILACGKVTFTSAIPTACTNGWDVKYNPDFVTTATPTDPELRFLVLHEATHKAYRHMHTWKALFKENPQLTNVAADHFVNLALQDTDAGSGFLKMPEVGIQPEAKYRGWSVQQIFNDLKQQEKDEPEDGEPGEPGDGEPGEPGDGEGESEGESEGMDEHDWDGSGDEAMSEEQGKEIERAVRQGEMLRRKRSSQGSGADDGVFGDLLNAKVDWRKVLRDFVTETCAGRDESSWRRPNRRFIADDVYMPSVIGTQMSELVIGFDTSGSCFGGADMTRFVSEIRTLLEDVKPAKCRVVYWDTAVVGEQVFENGQFAVHSLKPKGGGGTKGSVLFDYLREKNIKPDAIVQFSDGEVGSDWGHTTVPTLWALTTKLQAPFGTTIYLGD